MNRKFVYGPVASRRLRFSLGVDIIPYKHCSFNCIYCQVGRTTHLSVTRSAFVPVDKVLREIEEVLPGSGVIDYITFSGSGEPTLHSGLGALIQGVRAMTSIPIAVLTNSSLIHRPDVQDDLSQASVVAPTLCTTSDSTFTAIHRAHRSVKVPAIIDGLIAFRQSYSGAIWLEVMLIRGINDMDEELHELLRAIDLIRPDKVHLNTVVRPPLEIQASPVPRATLEHIKTMIGEKAEIITPLKDTRARTAHRNIERRVLDILQRRPCTLEDIAAISGIDPVALTKHLTRLVEQERVKIRRHQGAIFYETMTKEDA